jgi:hypothetical protein
MSPITLLAKTMHGSDGGPDVTWAGPNPFRKGLCFGFEDGTIVFLSDETGNSSEHHKISPSSEAINGVAAIGASSLAVSTRSDVSFIQNDSKKGNPRAAFPGGAHGVIATRSGYFVAPRGPSGLLIVKPTSDDVQPMTVTEGNVGHLYFSRVAAARDAEGRETLVFANRRNGVGLSPFNGEEQRRNVHTMRFDGIDVVDVCTPVIDSPAAIAISMAAEVLWIKNASTHDDPLAMRLDGVEGPVYRVLATPRHLFVLSSKALYMWLDLVGQVLFGKGPPTSSSPLVLPMQAVDMSLIEHESLVVVLAANAVTRLALSDLERAGLEVLKAVHAEHAPADLGVEMSRRTRLQDLFPKWHSADTEQRMMAGVQ